MSEYNTGSTDDRRLAMHGMADLAKTLITLSTGAIVLSGTFLHRFYNGELLGMLVAAWILFGLSVVLGLLAVGQYVSQLAESKLEVRRGLLEGLTLGQWVSSAVAVGLFAIFVLTNVMADP